MKRTNWLTAGVSTPTMVVTSVPDCVSTLMPPSPPTVIAFSAFLTSSSMASGWVIICSFCCMSQ